MMPRRKATALHHVIVGLAVALAGSAGDSGAQALPLPAEDSTFQLDADARVLPVWSNASGRVEALLLLDGPEAGSASALDRILAPRSSMGVGGRFTLGADARLQGALQFESDGGLALLCDGLPALAGPLGTLSERCLLADLSPTDPLLGAFSQRASLGANWGSADQRLDLSFGLSWIDTEVTPVSAWIASGADAERFDAAANFGPLAPWFAALDQRSLQLDGRLRLGGESRLLVGSSFGENRLLGWDGSAVRWNSAALSVGLGVGSVVGQLTGRLIELPERGERWNALDIGVSWRTPWRGELSVGARNVLGGGEGPRWPLAELPAIEDPESRVPYVRYQQDL